MRSSRDARRGARRRRTRRARRRRGRRPDAGDAAHRTRIRRARTRAPRPSRLARQIDRTRRSASLSARQPQGGSTLPGHPGPGSSISDRLRAVSTTRLGRDAARARARAWSAGVALAALLVALAPATSGGFGPSVSGSAAHTWAEIAVTLIGAGTCALLLVPRCPRARPRDRAGGAVRCAGRADRLSILWSVQPDGSWQAANLTVTYLLAFLAAIAAARMFPARWRSVVAGHRPRDGRAVRLRTALEGVSGDAGGRRRPTAGCRSPSATGTRPVPPRSSAWRRVSGPGSGARRAPGRARSPSRARPCC